MAGAGYKLFNTGDVLTAAQVNTYLNEQTVMVFASSAARTSALSGVLAEGMVSYLQDTNAVEVYNGSAWVSLAADQTPLTTKGDLFTFSTVDARLGVGANGTLLTADSSEATGLKWAAPAASGAMTLISRQNFSNVASITFSNVFTTTYENYLFIFTDFKAATNTNNLQFTLIKSGGTEETTGYYGVSISHAFNGSTFTFTSSSNASQFDMFFDSDRVVGQMFVTGSGAGASGRLGWVGQLGSLNSGYGAQFDGWGNTTATYTGIKFKSDSTNITGTITMYGLAKA